MNITVIGAGVGGLSAAYGLAKGGHNVTVYEKKAFEDLSYDWHDDVARSVFKDLDIPLPPEDAYFIKRQWSFNVPGIKSFVKLLQDPDTLDYSMERRPLAKVLVERARDAGANILFSKSIDRLIVNGDVIKGVVLEGKEILSDLVIDSSGMMSQFRASLAFLGFEAKPGYEGTFYAYRGFYTAKDGVPKETLHTNKGYIKWLETTGVSWCIQDPPTDGYNVLVGHIGALGKDKLEKCLNFIRSDNPALGDKLLRGGSVTPIPVRYTTTRLVANGYVLIGDSAFMTIPMLGSGIEASLRAGAILSDVVNKYRVSEAAKLWEYQVRYMREIGAPFIAIDYLKRWLLGSNKDDLAYLFESGVMSQKDLIQTATGHRLVLSVLDMLGKLIKGRKRIPLLLRLNGVLSKTKKGYKLGLKIPSLYDEAAIVDWSKKIEALFDCLNQKDK